MTTRTKLGWMILLAMTTPAVASAETSSSTLENWTWPPMIVAPLLIVGGWYLLGIVKLWRKNKSLRASQIICFWLGWISLLIALDSPLHEMGEQLFWVHMMQHEILMLISAPLLVLARPLVPFLWALPRRWREHTLAIGHLKATQWTWSRLTAPFCAWLLSAVALWVWHAPVLFDRTIGSDWIHAAQHVCFLGTALLFWWPLANRMPKFGYGTGIAYVFTTALHTSILGALLTFAQRPWYSSYIDTAPAWHLSALEDQQLGGLIMWVPAGTLLLIVALILLVKWMTESGVRWQYTRMAELTRLSEGDSK